MRELTVQEIIEVSGAAWSLEFDIHVLKGSISGDDTVQDMAGATMDAGASMYNSAVSAMTDFFTWWDPAGYYNAC